MQTELGETESDNARIKKEFLKLLAQFQEFMELQDEKRKALVQTYKTKVRKL